MAFLPVQSGTRVFGNGSSLAITVAPTIQFNLVTVPIAILNSNDTCTSVSDDKGNSYVLVGPADSGGEHTYMAYGVQSAGGTTAITVHFSGATDTKNTQADEWSGASKSNITVLDQFSTGGSSGTSLSVSTFNPTAAGKLIVAAACTGGNTTFTAGTGYTFYGTNGARFGLEYRLVGTTSESAPMTSSANIFWAEIALAFNPYVPTTQGEFFNLL